MHRYEYNVVIFYNKIFPVITRLSSRQETKFYEGVVDDVTFNENFGCKLSRDADKRFFNGNRKFKTFYEKL